MDGHEYQCFGSYWNDLAALPGGWGSHLASACVYGTLVDVSKHPLFVGEFSLEVTDCQKYLDGGYAEPYVPPSEYFSCNYKFKKHLGLLTISLKGSNLKYYCNKIKHKAI